MLGPTKPTKPGTALTGCHPASPPGLPLAHHQTFHESGREDIMRKGRVMEINPDSPIIAALRDSVAANPDSADARSVAAMLYQTALMESGFEVEDPKVCY